MSELYQEVKTYQVTMRCDDCYYGEMKPTGEILASNPPLYIHKCNNSSCLHEDSYKYKYPRIEYEKVIRYVRNKNPN